MTPPRRLVSRVYLFGVFLLIAVWIAVVGVGAAFGGMKPRREMPRRMLQHVAGDLAPLIDRPDELARELARASAELLTPLSIHDASGSVVLAAEGEEAPSLEPGSLPSAGEEVSELEEPRGFVVPLPSPKGPPLFLVGLRPAFDVPLEKPLSIFGAVLAVLALVSLPFARSIARPLERLTATAEELGRGKLSVRSGLRRNDEVGTLARAFDEMAERLEALVRNEKELLANVSHELRTPLSRIRVAVELAEEGDLEQARGYLREIGADLVELDRLIEDVLTAARLDRAAGTFPLRPCPVDPSTLVRRSAERFRRAHGDRDLVVDLEAGLPELMADEVLLRRVLDNLLDNARKYSDGPVVLGAKADPDGVALWVEDRGIGIDPADIERLFEPFFRTDRSRTRRSGGLGLGLTLARRIVEAHGGTLRVRSEPERGSTFTVWLPCGGFSASTTASALPFGR